EWSARRRQLELAHDAVANARRRKERQLRAAGVVRRVERIGRSVAGAAAAVILIEHRRPSEIDETTIDDGRRRETSAAVDLKRARFPGVRQVAEPVVSVVAGVPKRRVVAAAT